jgi:hypothetical protein
LSCHTFQGVEDHHLKGGEFEEGKIHASKRQCVISNLQQIEVIENEVLDEF